jgi:SAM-dependent methyltransferase
MDAKVRELLAEVAVKYSQPEEVAEMNRRMHKGAGLIPPEQILLNYYYPFPCRVLDVSCGTGLQAIALARQGHKVTGVNLAASLVGQARRNAVQQGVGVTFKRIDDLKLDVDDASFDLAVIFSQKIQHLPGRSTRVAFLREIARILVPAGFVFLSAHDRYHPTMNDLCPSFESIAKPDGEEGEEAEEGDVYLLNLHGVESKGKAFFHYSTPDELRVEVTEAGLHVWQVARHSELGGEPGMDRLFYMVAARQPFDPV